MRLIEYQIKYSVLLNDGEACFINKIALISAHDARMNDDPNDPL